MVYSYDYSYGQDVCVLQTHRHLEKFYFNFIRNKLTVNPSKNSTPARATEAFADDPVIIVARALYVQKIQSAGGFRSTVSKPLSADVAGTDCLAINRLSKRGGTPPRNALEM